jgi:hypothetical protein
VAPIAIVCISLHTNVALQPERMQVVGPMSGDVRH